MHLYHSTSEQNLLIWKTFGPINWITLFSWLIFLKDEWMRSGSLNKQPPADDPRVVLSTLTASEVSPRYPFDFWLCSGVRKCGILFKLPKTNNVSSLKDSLVDLLFLFGRPVPLSPVLKPIGDLEMERKREGDELGFSWCLLINFLFP